MHLIRFIFVRCPRSSVAVTPVKYKRDIIEVPSVLIKLKYWENNGNNGLVTPTPDLKLLMARSHQTRSQYVLQNVAERGQTVCERNEGCDNCLESIYELNGRFMDAVDGLEREGHSRTSRLLKILRRPSHSEIGRSDNVLKTWTFYERNCRTSDLLGTHYNVVQSSISYSTCARRPRAFLLRWSRSHTDQLDHTAIVTTFILIKYVQNKIKSSGWVGPTPPYSS